MEIRFLKLHREELVMDSEDLDDNLADEAKRVVDEQMTHREKLEEASIESSDEINRPGLDEQEVEFLKNNRKRMSNDELEKFMKGDKSFQREGWKKFSRTEEKYILQNYSMKEIEDIAADLDREVEDVKQKIMMMGLEV